MTVKMPEPIAWVRRHPDGALSAEYLEDGAIEPVRKESGAWLPVVTTDQAQAYADAVRREALEEALAVVADEQKSLCDDDHELGWSDCADAIYKNIRALIPPTPPTEKP